MNDNRAIVNALRSQVSLQVDRRILSPEDQKKLAKKQEKEAEKIKKEKERLAKKKQSQAKRDAARLASVSANVTQDPSLMDASGNLTPA